MRIKTKVSLSVVSLLVIMPNLVNAITVASYYSNINSNNNVYKTDLFLYVQDNYCENDPSVWSVNVPILGLNAVCYDNVNGNSYWKVSIRYDGDPGDSVTIYYNRGSVSDSFTFNPLQFYKYDFIKKVNLGQESVFIGEPSFVRSIESNVNSSQVQVVLLQTIGFDNTSSYTLKLFEGATEVGSFKGKLYSIQNLNLMLFLNTKPIDDGVYNFKIFKDDEEVGDFISYLGNYNINFYGFGVYIYKKIIIKGDSLYIRVMNTEKVPITLNRIKFRIVSNNLQFLISTNANLSVVLNPNDSKNILVSTIDSNTLTQLTSSLNIMTVELYYTVNSIQKYRKISTLISRKDVSYTTQVSGYVKLGQINLIYPRPLATIINDNFNEGTTSISGVPIVFLFVENYNGYTLYIDNMDVNLHPIHGGTANVVSIDKVETVYTSSGLPVGVYRVKVDYSNINNGIIPIVGTVTINAHYYISFFFFQIPVYVTLTYPIEFVLNTKNVQDAINYVNQLQTPIYNRLSDLSDNFKTYDYFWLAFSKDVDSGASGIFFDYYDTAGDSFPVTDITQNPKVLVSYNQDTVSIYFDSALKKYFNYDDMFTLVLNEDGVLKEPLSYTMTNVQIGDSDATRVDISLDSELSVKKLGSDYYFMKAYQTNGFLILKHQIYKTILPYSMFKPFSVYFDSNGLTILNKGKQSLLYYPDASNTNNYYIINSGTYQTDLPIGQQPLIIYSGTYYYINPNYDFKPKLINEHIYLPITTIINPGLLSSFIVSDVETKKLYDLFILQIFPQQYKDFILKSNKFYTFSLIDTNITSLKFNTTTVQPEKLKEYYLYSYKIVQYLLPTQLYSEIDLTASALPNYTVDITYSDSSTRTTHLLIFDLIRRDFISNIQKTPTLYTTPQLTIFSYYDPRLASDDLTYSFIINSVNIEPYAELKSVNHIVLYYNGELSQNTFIGINGDKIFMIIP